jgi:hypothetical protein
MKLMPIESLLGELLGEFAKKNAAGGCADECKFAILVFVAGVTQLVE